MSLYIERLVTLLEAERGALPLVSPDSYPEVFITAVA